MEVKVARGFYRRFTAAAVAALLLFSLVPSGFADPAPAPPLTARPLTILKYLETQYRYVPTLMGKYQQARAEALSKVAAVAPGAIYPFNGGSPPPYDRGADIGEIVQNVLKDFQVIIGDFLDCLDFKIVGLCYKITWTGIHFDIYREYRLPVQDVEVVQTPFESGFIPKFVNNAILPIVEETYYPLAKDIASTSMNWTSSALETQGNIVGADFQAPSGMDGDDQAEDKVKQIERKKRFRNSDPIAGPGRYAEYTVLPQLFNQVMGHLWFFCHDVLPPGVWSSYYPLTILPARMSALSFFFFPFQMINKFVVPNTCSGKNNMLRGGKTPLDMTLTGISAYDAMNVMSPGMGCLNKNDENWVPVTNTVNNSSFPVASVNSAVKGIKMAYTMMPFSFYDINLDRDRWQWSHSDRMPDNCSKLERFVRDFGNANMKKGKDNWNVGIHWRYFRCCARGFHVLIGPQPIIRR